MPENKPKVAETSPARDTLECGLIMPISETASHTSSHWANVLSLHHRAIRLAGLTPLNVWENASIDRITPRIIGNIFKTNIALCDISDKNPNVMFELGMRLASKKPTIIVAEFDTKIPFDIADFEILFYPGDLNILGMEEYFDSVSECLKRKSEAYSSGSYVPFLADIQIDVLEPKGRAVPFEELVVNSLDSISSRISVLEKNNNSRSSVSTINLRTRDVDPIRGVLIDCASDHDFEKVVEEISKSGYAWQSFERNKISIPIDINEGQNLVRRLNNIFTEKSILADARYRKNLINSDF